MTNEPIREALVKNADTVTSDVHIACRRERDELRAENEWLRMALEEIADVAHPTDMRAANIAREALGRV